MIHSIWILSVLYRIPTYLPFFHYYHYNIYAIILISLYRTAGPSRCLFFVIFVLKTGKTATIHGCCLIIPHTSPTIRANVAYSWYTYTKVSALYWYLYYSSLVYHIDKILRTIEGDSFNSPTLCFKNCVRLFIFCSMQLLSWLLMFRASIVY